MNENELREWLERLTDRQRTDTLSWSDEQYDAFTAGCAEGEASLASEILRKFLK
jgi:hypothetical protein